MKLNFYNTLTRTKEEFKPLEGNTVRIYSCGPTVYKDATIGNMKSYIFMDTLRRVLKYNGYDLKHAMLYSLRVLSRIHYILVVFLKYP